LLSEERFPGREGGGDGEGARRGCRGFVRSLIGETLAQKWAWEKGIALAEMKNFEYKKRKVGHQERRRGKRGGEKPLYAASRRGSSSVVRHHRAAPNPDV